MIGTQLDTDDLALLQHLRRMRLQDVVIVGSPSPTFCLPFLRHMTVWGSWTCLQSVGCFLTPSMFPQLRHLELNDFTDPTAVRTIIPQLEAISFQPFSDYLPHMSNAPQLLRLLPATLRRVIDQLPTLPPFLFVEYEEDPFYDPRKELLDALEELAESEKESLRVIILSVDGVDDDAEMVDMIQWVESEGIRVERAEGEITF